VSVSSVCDLFSISGLLTHRSYDTSYPWKSLG